MSLSVEVVFYSGDNHTNETSENQWSVFPRLQKGEINNRVQEKKHDPVIRTLIQEGSNPGKLS